VQKRLKKKFGTRYTTTTFIDKSNEVHGHKYDYTKVVYQDSHTPVEIVCSIHGSFFQRPHAHINLKQGCPKCGLKNRTIPHKKSATAFIDECKDKWGDKYDYSTTVYNGKTKKITYSCPEHGVVEQYPVRHLKCGCPFCNGRGISKHSLTSFTNIANVIHGNKYDYSKTKFVRMTDDITISCPIHGEFEQRAANHIHLKNGCPKCASAITSSRAEKEIVEFIGSLYNGVIQENVRILNGKEVDAFIPEFNLGLEYHGLYWHLETIRGKSHHYEKWATAHAMGIRLFQIYENEWRDKSTIIKSKISGVLGLNKKIGARKTKIIQLDNNTKNEFLDQNHLQGSDSSKIAFGLEFDGKIVACMTFGPSRFNKKYQWELLRFCNVLNTNVIGGAGKLLSHFKAINSGSIISYADKRYSDGGLYHKLGFRLDGETQPSFMYVRIKNSQTYNRMKFQKQYLKDVPGYDENLTEYEIMQLNGYDRIWDAGQYRFVLD